MGDYVSKKKRNKKVTVLDIIKGIRKVWEINPKTRIKRSKKGYNRTRDKRVIERRGKYEH